MNRLSVCRKFCGVYSLQNGTRCRDGIKVLWCHSELVWLVLRLLSLHALVFLQKTFCDLFLLLFYFLFCIVIYKWKEGRMVGGEAR